MTTFFPFADYWTFYVGFIIFVLGMLLLDLGVFRKEDKVESSKSALMWTAFWVGLALLFNVGLYYYMLYSHGEAPAKQIALEFLTGFLIEKALAVDNVFVFLVVFSFFSIPKKYQHRVLFYGILGALFFRAIFIALGAVLMKYHFMLYFFGALLIFTGIKVWFAKENEKGLAESKLYQFLTRHMKLTHQFDGHNFFTRINGVRYGTPMLVTLIFIELSDIVFAIDSVPAIFAITKEPFIVFTSNIFAILGLRALFLFISSFVEKFHLLKYALGAILIFVGLKMAWLNDLMGGKFPIGWSLGIIALFLAGAIIGSLLFPKKAT